MNDVSRVCELRQRKRLESESAPNALQTTMRKVCSALNTCSPGSSAQIPMLMPHARGRGGRRRRQKCEGTCFEIAAGSPKKGE